jgi:hypothetical protein
MTARELEEYRALRDTIRERGTARLWIVLAGLALWTALTTTVAVLSTPPVLSLVTLLLLVTVFEVVFSIHTAVERIGRYVQVFLEDDGSSARWEHTAMGFGSGRRKTAAGGGPMDALFSPLFMVAAVLNLVPVIIAAPVPVEWLVIGVVHLLFVVRIAAARRAAASQRQADLERYREMKNASMASGSAGPRTA